jgi:hypothetical protein
MKQTTDRQVTVIKIVDNGVVYRTCTTPYRYQKSRVLEDKKGKYFTVCFHKDKKLVCTRFVYITDLVDTEEAHNPFFYLSWNKDIGGLVMDELKEKLRGFDWFYMFSDDHEVWRKWSTQKHETMKWAKDKGYTKEQVLEAVKFFNADHHVVSDWTYKD